MYEILVAALLFLSMAGSLFAQADPPTDGQIQQRLQLTVVQNKLKSGIVVGIIDEHGSKVIAYGNSDDSAVKPVNGDTVFEIGSVTKVFTTLLLADMVDRGQVKLDDAIGKFLPATVKLPSRNGRQITLLDLATHTSGLPRLPGDMSTIYMLFHGDNPYAAYGTDQLYDFLSHYELTRDIGAQYEYSNLGMGLLGHILTIEAGVDYEKLVVNHICVPLHMDATRINLSPQLKSRLATGHDAFGSVAGNWDFDVLAGCGALRSSVNDLLKFLSANMGLSPCTLSAAMQETHAPLRKADSGQKTALGWLVTSDGIIWHNGQTAGYKAFIAFNPQTRRGVVVLANSVYDIDRLGWYALGPARTHKLVSIDYRLYDKYVGQYDFTPQLSLTITRQGDHLLAQITGQAAVEVFPESDTTFFYKVVDAQLTFVTNEAGKVTQVILHQNGLDQTAAKTK
jgi:CubicO group peptidase (beta-lactamase class C family)